MAEQAAERDEKGRFLPKYPQTISNTSETEGSVKGVEKLLSIKEDKQDDETLIDVKIANPLHRITEILQDIKNKQATTVSLRFTIPLIALPIAFLAVFQLGRIQNNCVITSVTEQGSLKTISVMVPKNKSSFLTPVFRMLPFYTEDFEELAQVQKTVLTTLKGETYTLSLHPSVTLPVYKGEGAYVTGEVNTCAKTLYLNSLGNINNL